MSLVWRNAAGAASPTGDVNEELTARLIEHCVLLN